MLIKYPMCGNNYFIEGHAWLDFFNRIIFFRQKGVSIGLTIDCIDFFYIFNLKTLLDSLCESKSSEFSRMINIVVFFLMIWCYLCKISSYFHFYNINDVIILFLIIRYLESSSCFNIKSIYKILLTNLFYLFQIFQLLQFLIYKSTMKSIIVFLIFLTIAASIPEPDQMCLASSLIVGRDDDEDLINWTCKVCDSSNKPIHAHSIEEKAVDVKCILAVYPNYVILAFRYTNTALNVWQDILYPYQVKDDHTCDKCKVQKAYNNMWEKIRPNVTKDLIQMRYQTKLNTLYITGISLGGGLTVISYIDISHENIFPIVKVITFGAPRVGNKYWAAHFDLITNGHTKRYIVSGDPIVVLPRCLTLLCTYRQTGIKIVCYENQQICKQEQQIPDPDDEVQIVRHLARDIMEVPAGLGLQSIMDHVDGYPKIYNFTLILK